MWTRLSSLLFLAQLFCGTGEHVPLADTYCVCTTVDCPVVGKNPIVMGNGYAHITYTYEKHNQYNVVSYVTGEITPESLDTGTETTSCTRKYSRMLEDDGEQSCDAGHILARRLGGYGNLPMNIFPQNSTINEGIFSQFEGKIYDCTKNGTKTTYLTWVFDYESDQHTMPYQVTYSASFEGGTCDDFSSSFPN